MRRTRLIILIALIALPLLGAGIGRLSGPALSRLNYIVNVAEHVWNEEKNGPGKEEDQLVKAFRSTGMPATQIYDQAREIRERFTRGATWFGLWCGLVAGIRLASSLVWRRRHVYESDPMDCLACGRCYLSCPLERKRLKRLQRPLAEHP